MAAATQTPLRTKTSLSASPSTKSSQPASPSRIPLLAQRASIFGPTAPISPSIHLIISRWRGIRWKGVIASWRCGWMVHKCCRKMGLRCGRGIVILNMGFIGARRGIMIRWGREMCLIAMFMGYRLVMRVWRRLRDIVGWGNRVCLGGDTEDC